MLSNEEIEENIAEIRWQMGIKKKEKNC